MMLLSGSGVCKLLVEIMTAANFNFSSKFPPKWELFSHKFCIFGAKIFNSPNFFLPSAFSVILCQLSLMFVPFVSTSVSVIFMDLNVKVLFRMQ